ncbi:aldehyde dehydrogenase family protein [Glutamicibacter soli]|uniref:Aldehyde dehydrogenase family protein n=1 Tax=Glutamicibacter soli TaxID=453836 RepID=A0A6L9G485_9MICC|nr:aldehyde dehydrogenase (NADP(+)) [Glutamicibacter soli]NAZ16054.1 aldehyde dehydrogenase family protein [Glutamicibacter soli]
MQQNTIEQTSAEQLEQILQRAGLASAKWAQIPAAERARIIEQAAAALAEAGDTLVAMAMEETNLPEPRLRGELKRTVFQLGLFAETIRDGACFDARIDHADAQWPMGAARPDLRRILIPVGPVLVFAASNFPFAFSVAGGDTASALAAGNAVVLKAHSGHPKLSQATASIFAAALEEAGAPKGLFSVIFGTASGSAAIEDPRIKAAGFTGSIPGGRALFDKASARPEPIPFFGELGSNNPVFVTSSAAAANAEEIVDQFIGSFTMGAGQFCTKPGTLVVPEDSNFTQILASKELPAVHKLLNERIEAGYLQTLSQLKAHEGVEVLAQHPEAENDHIQPTLLVTTGEQLLTDPQALQEECFGPAALVVTYKDEAQLLEIASSFAGQLTATICGETGDDVAQLLVILQNKAGRVLWNQWPTGVSVTYAQQHGGPYPASTVSNSTSVGTAAIARFLRPVAYQGFPQDLLPAALQDDAEGVRLLDGQRQG